LLTGERGHYALALGEDPMPYLRAMTAMTGPGGMMPEQVWDAAALPEARLFPGSPTGSAMPLAWAHAEFIKLIVSHKLGHPVDRPTAVWRRYSGRPPAAEAAIWCPHAPVGRIARGNSLAIALPQGAMVRWSVDDWQTLSDADTADTGLGLHAFELCSASIGQAERIDFTFRWRDTAQWVGSDYRVTVDG
jgi:glucoamylase